MALTVANDAGDHGPDRPRGLHLRRIATQETPIWTNFSDRASNGRKRGSALINIATALLMALAAALYVVSINSQFSTVMAAKDNDIVSWVEAVSLDAGMAVFTLLALGLSRAGQSARIERLAIVACSGASAAMNLASANSADVRSILVFVCPPLFLAGVVDRTVSVVRRHYMGDDDASAWSNLGKVALYSLRFVLAPVTSARGGRRWVLNATPVPESTKEVPTAGPVQAITAPVAPFAWPLQAAGPSEPVSSKPRSQVRAGHTAPAARAPRTGTKTADLIRIAQERHGALASIPLESCSKIATVISAEIGMHGGSARSALLKAARAAQNGGKR